MPDLSTSEVCWSLRAPGLRLEFGWTGDRWTHELQLDPGDGFLTVARAIEADPARDLPGRVVSPTYQQIDFDRGADVVGALLIGQAGPHHFSAVFAVIDGPDEVAVEVDVADRCPEPVESLACTYLVDLPSGDLRAADPSAIAWEAFGGAGGRLVFEGSDAARVALAEAGRRGARVQAESRIDPASRTHRCRYRWRLKRKFTGVEQE